MKRTKIIVIVILSCPFLRSSVMAQPINGDFSAFGTGWTYDVVAFDGSIAVLYEDPVYTAYLEQVFTIPNFALSLSFDYRPAFEIIGEESFSVSLLDPGTFLPLIPTNANPSDPLATYYFMHDWDGLFFVDDVITDPAYVTMTDLGGGWTNVELDLTSLGGATTGALVAFDLIPGFFDIGLGSQVEVDNVSVTVQPIPAPGAILLGSIGAGMVGWLRRRRTL